MALKHLVFDNNPGNYKLAILLKSKAMKHTEVLRNYVAPLEKRGISPSEIIAYNLEFNEQDKAPVRLIKEHMEVLKKALEFHGITHVLVTDASYFKVICKLRKAEPHYGYVLPAPLYAPIRAALSVNYQSLFFNPSLKDRLMLGIEAITREINGKESLFQQNIFSDVRFPETTKEIQAELNDLLKYDKLTCDIETPGLHLQQSRVLSIAFGKNKRDGVAFRTWPTNAITVYTALKSFLDNYQGKLIFHNAPFDTGRLIYQLYMHLQNKPDLTGMLQGLHTLYRNTDDTQILAYLALNSTAGNSLGLKDLAFEFTGNYALENIDNPTRIDLRKLLEYNVTDALATWYVYDKYREVVREEQEETYQKVFRPALKVITQMELCGMPVHQEPINQTAKSLAGATKQYLSNIESSNIIQEFNKKLRLWEALEANKKLKKLRKTTDDFADIDFNPNSTKQLRGLLYEHLKLPVFRKTDTGLASTDGKTLDALISHLKKEYSL